MALRALILLAAASLAVANQAIYNNRQLLSGWSDASYDTQASYTGDTIKVQTGPYGTFALKNPAVALTSFSGVQFDVKGDPSTNLHAFLQSTKNPLNSNNVDLSDEINPGAFSTVQIDFASIELPAGPWDTITIQTYGDQTVNYELDNVILLS
ncbi:hypothetical protein EIP91_009210 [Steccherinum ochraceum]|uniref:Uncharacterized protein n=1 Tax=Steccherinum ochraceum TaxID=92696 RepID=A0A4R0RXT7_9APHY|nr:hypothetical protein EIP91_009210 [Steccherinum ochraceum]